jgi:hypothetical protein
MRRLVLLLALALAPAAQAQTPDEDPFYAAPAGLAKAKPGAILRKREIDVTAVGFPLPVDGHQILYRTADTHGTPEATVATVLVPQGEAPAGGRPLLAYQPAEDSLTRRCSSSYEIRQGQNPELANALPTLLQEGAAVVVPDYEGPESQWVAGHQAGHAVLDAIRATESFAPAGVSGVKTPVAVWGYSGGAQATAWAAELAPRYAPELKIVASAHGAAPYVLRKTIAYVDGTSFAGILLAAVVGIGRAYPEMRLDEYLNDAGKTMKADVGDKCIEEFALGYPGAHLDDFMTVPAAEDLPHIARIIDHNDLGHRTPDAPTYVYQSATDELEPVAGADDIVANYCRRGVAVSYRREPAGEHIEFQIRGTPDAAAYIAARWRGEPAPNGCAPLKPCPVVVKLRQKRRAVVFVDGRRVGVRRARRFAFSLEPGNHVIRLKLRHRVVVKRRAVVC